MYKGQVMTESAKYNHTIRNLERAYMKKQRKKIYIALEEIDFNFDTFEVKKVINEWRSGLSIHEIAESIDRDIDETFLLLFDLAKKEKIEKRKGGIWG